MLILSLLMILVSDFSVKIQCVYYDVGSIRIERPDPNGNPNTVLQLSASHQDWLNQMTQDWLRPGGEPDLNGDGVVNMLDFNELSRMYKWTGIKK